MWATLLPNSTQTHNFEALFDLLSHTKASLGYTMFPISVNSFFLKNNIKVDISSFTKESIMGMFAKDNTMNTVQNGPDHSFH